ncbi:hypothetical protein [Pseudovibrio sp. Ad26]|uniref:hypothetical protein n=1 Tax=Pseudovibrio sp. Ad26 TaxID=989410 RepID=UPI0007AE8987|nr:hypothetical protein [Pseudovibrio sp. Ad26]KZL02628.1 hypothetical protein PsAD26_04708 [Pseudovibrio sp. Ad26]
MKKEIAQVLLLLVLFMFQGNSSVANDSVKFALIEADKKTSTFSFIDSYLNFSSSSPKDFIWNKADAPVAVLDDAQVVSEFTEEYIGYDPLNRDRLEIRLYAAKIIPERVALGVGYGRLLASKWGALNFGEFTHDHDFGEVLGGDNSSGVMLVNRISVMRRGQHILIIRSRFDADYFDQYKDAIATFVGSIEFAKVVQKDPIVASLETAYLFEKDPEYKFKYHMPSNWKRAVSMEVRRKEAEFDFWLDVGDNLGNSAALAFVIPSSDKRVKAGKFTVDPDRAANIAREYAKSLISNVSSNRPFHFTGIERAVLPRFEQITSYNELFNFSGNLELEDEKGSLPYLVSVMVTLGEKGTLNTTAVMTTEHSNDYRFGTKNHVEFTHQLMMDAQEHFWKVRASQPH